jgi:predicted ATPase
MHFSKFKLENYKSFRSTENLSFTPGFNVIVGRNDVGKTALVEGLSLTFGHEPHRSKKTMPYRDDQLPEFSRAHCTVHLAGDEMQALLLKQPLVTVPWDPAGDKAHFDALFNELLITGADLMFSWEPSNILDVQVLQYPMGFNAGLQYIPQRGAVKWVPLEGVANISARSSFAYVLADCICSSIYAFKAERQIRGEAPIESHGELANNASNLPTVLHYLQTEYPYRFEEFKRLVRDVFPHIQQMRVPSRNNTQAHIYLGMINPAEKREDLDIPLAAKGTGVGQVLAMLYVVFTAEFPRIIVIDEPQSFLHPGAIYRLFNILKTDYPQHQYILTTHSPAVVAATEPMTSFLLTWSEGETAIEPVDYAEAAGLPDVLAELGVRLTDVFGADRLLWVEGRTEEHCFPMIYRALTQQSLGGTRILSVHNTGDFDAKAPDRILGIYERLSQGSALMPPIVGFLLDRELHTPQQREDWRRQGRGTISFLERRMYENYLLNPETIAEVLNHADPSGDTNVTPSKVEEWLRSHGQSEKFLESNARYCVFPEEAWCTEVDGANVLATLFQELSEGRVAYRKVQHGMELTRWLLDHKPETLQPIADAISALLT